MLVVAGLFIIALGVVISMILNYSRYYIEGSQQMSLNRFPNSCLDTMTKDLEGAMCPIKAFTAGPNGSIKFQTSKDSNIIITYRYNTIGTLEKIVQTAFPSYTTTTVVAYDIKALYITPGSSVNPLQSKWWRIGIVGQYDNGKKIITYTLNTSAEIRSSKGMAAVIARAVKAVMSVASSISKAFGRL